MQHYILVTEEKLIFSCQADDVEHAIEQATDDDYIPIILVAQVVLGTI